MQQQRVIQLEGTLNFRDFGGFATREGRFLKWGLLYRSENLARVPHREAPKLKRLGLETVVDLQTPNESKSRPDGVVREAGIRLLPVPIYPRREDPGRVRQLAWFLSGGFGEFDPLQFVESYYRRIAFDHPDQIRRIVTLISDAANLPILFHCTGGKDRTGFVAAITQLVVGVPRDTVLADYMLTEPLLEPRFDALIRRYRRMTLFRISADTIRPILEARREYLEQILDEVLERYGSIENYLVSGCGVLPETLASLRDTILD